MTASLSVIFTADLGVLALVFHDFKKNRFDGSCLVLTLTHHNCLDLSLLTIKDATLD